MKIDEYSFGRIVVDGEEHSKDVIILPDRVVPNWWRKDGHGLVIEDLDEVIDELPSTLVLGTGAYGRMNPGPEAIAQLEARGIEVEALPTDRAVTRFNESNSSTTAAALHLTC